LVHNLKSQWDSNADFHRAIKPGILLVGDIEFNRDALIVKRAGKEIILTSLEYALLEFLMVESGKMVSRARILENVWGTTDDPLTNVVDVYIRRLRAHIDDGHPTQLIKPCAVAATGFQRDLERDRVSSTSFARRRVILTLRANAA